MKHKNNEKKKNQLHQRKLIAHWLGLVVYIIEKIKDKV